MLIATWIVTAVLAAVNLLSGAGKAFTPWEKLSARMPWTETSGKTAAYLAAWSEIVGAIGVIVPNVLAHTLSGWEWAGWVSFAAAIGLAVVQVLAIGVHVKRSEYRNLPINVGLVALGAAGAILIATTQ